MPVQPSKNAYVLSTTATNYLKSATSTDGGCVSGGGVPHTESTIMNVRDLGDAGGLPTEMHGSW